MILLVGSLQGEVGGSEYLAAERDSEVVNNSISPPLGNRVRPIHSEAAQEARVAAVGRDQRRDGADRFG